jgi:hypothetical protein
MVEAVVSDHKDSSSLDNCTYLKKQFPKDRHMAPNKRNYFLFNLLPLFLYLHLSL